MAIVNTFAGSPLDRAGARRSDVAWVDAVTRDGVLVSSGEDGGAGALRLARLPVGALGGERLLLGIEPGGSALFAVDASDSPAPPGVETVGLRDAGALLSHGEGGVIAQATGLVNWHRRHPRCAVCGAPTLVADAGYLRRCPECGAEHH